MYSRKELAAVRRALSAVARGDHVSEAKVRADIMEAMNIGRSFPDPEVQARWAQFHYDGPEPTVEEFILWLVTAVKKKTAIL